MVRLQYQDSLSSVHLPGVDMGSEPLTGLNLYLKEVLQLWRENPKQQSTASTQNSEQINKIITWFVLTLIASSSLQFCWYPSISIYSWHLQHSGLNRCLVYWVAPHRLQRLPVQNPRHRALCLRSDSVAGRRLHINNGSLFPNNVKLR